MTVYKEGREIIKRAETERVSKTKRERERTQNLPSIDAYKKKMNVRVDLE